MLYAAAALSLFLALAVHPSTVSTAHAYCRSTTCTGDCARDDDGCKTEGKPLYWPTSCVGFSLQKDGTEHFAFKYFEDVAERSFLSWTDVGCETGGVASLAFSRLDDVACHQAEYNEGGANANIILFQDTQWRYTSADNTLAKTTVTFNADTGEILDADIELNHAYNNFTISDTNIEYDLESVLTHEVGHMIGLDHTLDPYATMHAAYEPGNIDPRTLEPDDIAGLCAAYPDGRKATCQPEPNGGLGDQCGGEPASEDGGGGCAVSSGVDSSSVAKGVLMLLALVFIVRKKLGTPS